MYIKTEPLLQQIIHLLLQQLLLMLLFIVLRYSTFSRAEGSAGGSALQMFLRF